MSKLTARWIVPALGYLGLLPFLAAGLLVVTNSGVTDSEPAISAPFLFASYSALILSFLGGTLWGQTLVLAPTAAGTLLLASNLFALAAWASLLLAETYFVATLLCLMLGFAALWLIEYLQRAPFTSTTGPYYMTMRGVLTAIVLATHLLVLVYSL